MRYSPTEKRLAFAGSQEFCDETEKPPALPGVHGELGEERGTVHFIEIRDLKNAVVERLSSARGTTVKRLNELVGKITTLPPGKRTLGPGTAVRWRPAAGLLRPGRRRELLRQR